MPDTVLSAYTKAVNTRDRVPAFMQLLCGKDTVSKTSTCVRWLYILSKIEGVA